MGSGSTVNCLRLASLFYPVSPSSLFLLSPSFLLPVSNEQKKLKKKKKKPDLQSGDVETVSQDNQMLWQKKQLAQFLQDVTFYTNKMLIRCLTQSDLNILHVLFFQNTTYAITPILAISTPKILVTYRWVSELGVWW